ncbi:MAG: TonB family protein [Flavobacteriales bacterium]|nr:TonB family protein [Flavobacteriales bacterium]
MEVKKSIEADAEGMRSSLFMVGLNYIAGLTLAAFTFQSINTDDDLSKLDDKAANNVFQQEVKKEETPPPPAQTPQVNVPAPVTDQEIIVEENKEEEPVTVVEVPPVVEIAEEEIITVVEEIIEFPDVEATFPGGPAAMMKWINSNIQYPQTSIEMNEQGRVFLSFVVEADGSVSNVAVEKGVSEELDREAKRVVRSMPPWTPGEAKGKKARTRCRLPINFQLN